MGPSISVCYRSILFVLFLICFGLVLLVHQLTHLSLSYTTPAGQYNLENAEKGGYAVGAFNVYNLEGIEAVVATTEAEKSPAFLQIHPSALKQGGVPLVACCIAAAEQSSVPISVHYDHGISKSDLLQALETSITSLPHAKGLLVEAELGRLSGFEDGLTVEEYEARFTDVAQVERFIDETSIDALAVCIGNVHGKYPPSGPNLIFEFQYNRRRR
ncbi:unnamed protein product [Miscanthus lutarioriparius]|uniref:Fructose-bisphosphate aldolase n=1 Tax=Miscanthus lutarioriparius TaxID=422564 RepID=A0A811Q379_9POAL|nr:unnamed protein product [Miscanthus lutarioriparius]